MFTVATEQIDINAALNYLLSHTNNLISAAIILVIGFILVKCANSMLNKALKKSN